MASLPRREFRLKQTIDRLRDDYDYIFIDTPPSLGLLTLNALVAADAVIVPLNAEYFALEGLADLVGTLRRVQASLNPGLDILGVLLTMHDERTNLAQQVTREIREFFGERVYTTIIPRNVQARRSAKPREARHPLRREVARAPRRTHARPRVHRTRARPRRPRMKPMADKRPALGRGLSALIPDATAAQQPPREPPSEVDLDLLGPNPFQPRLNFDEARLEELAASIRSNGIIQPILVRRRDRRYEIIAGERRWRAAQRAGPAQGARSSSARCPDDKLLEVALIENIQRENLNPIDEAIAYRRLIDEFALTQESLATAVGKERSTIANTLRLLQLPDAAAHARHHRRALDGPRASAARHRGPGRR